MKSPVQKLPRVWRDTGRVALAAGWTVAFTGGGHIRWTSPARSTVITSMTPSDRRALLNAKRDFKRNGLELE